MGETVFVEFRFWLLVVASVMAPIAIHWVLGAKRSISRLLALELAIALVFVAALQVYLLQWLKARVPSTSSLADDAVFSSELSAALYVLPLFYGGVGVNVVSHLLVRHVLRAEREHDAEARR